MSRILEKTTTFRGHASGDCECFCFDRRTEEEIAADEVAYRALREAPLSAIPRYDHEAAAALIGRERAARIYPDALLPEGSTGERSSPMGTWTITVRFEPDERGSSTSSISTTSGPKKR